MFRGDPPMLTRGRKPEAVGDFNALRNPLPTAAACYQTPHRAAGRRLPVYATAWTISRKLAAHAW